MSSSPFWPSEILSPTPEALNPTIFSVGRAVGGASASSFLSTDANGYLTTAFSVSAFQAADDTLSALAGLSSALGGLFQIGTDSFTKRTLTGTTNQVSIANGDGVSGNPTFSLPQDIHTSATPQFLGLGLGTAYNSSYRLNIQGSGNSSATEAIRVSNSDTTNIFQLQNNGYLGLGGTSTTSKLTVVNTQTDAAIGGVQSTVSFTGTDGTARSHYSFSGTTTVSSQVSAAHQGYGINLTLQTIVGSGATNTGINAGVYSNASINSSQHAGTLSNLFAGYFRVGATSSAVGSGAITSQHGLYVLVDFAKPTSLATTNSYGLRIAGNSTTSYPTNNWGIYEEFSASASGSNYLASPLQIGTTTRSANFILSRNHSLSAWGVNGINFRVATGTFTDTSSTSGTVASNAINSIAGGTLAASNAGVTYTNAHTLYVGAAPVTGSNVSITNAWNFWANTGNSRYGGDVYVGTGSTFDSTQPNNLLSGASTNTGIQVRGNATYAPVLEFFRYTNAVANGGTVGRISAWAGSPSAIEVSRIESQAVGTAENAASLIFSTATGGTLSERLRLESTGRTVVQTLNLPNTSTPASSGAAGTTGDIAWDSSYLYVCVGPSQWKRVALSSW